MIPLAIAAGVAVASGIMQYYQSEKARKASSKRLGEIEAMFNQIVPPDFNVQVWDDPKLVATIPEPAFNTAKITPEMYQKVGQYVPQVAEFVREKNPELVKATEEAKQGRAAQMDALERYKQIARSGADPELAQRLAESSRRARTDAQSRQASILQDAQRRGQGGSLASLATQLSGAEDAMQRQAMESQMAAAESYRNKLRALDQSASLGGQIRQSEMSEAGRNADIINDFNQRTSARYQQYVQMRADAANQARLRNLGEEQRISDANVGLRNDAKQEHVNRSNSLAQMQFQNQRQNRQDRIAIEEYKNKLRQLQYDNEMAKTAGRAGVQYARANLDMETGRQNAAAVKGVGDAVAAGAMTYGKYNQEKSPPPAAAAAPQQPLFAGYDYGSTPGNYRRLDDEYWRTA